MKAVNERRMETASESYSDDQALPESSPQRLQYEWYMAVMEIVVVIADCILNSQVPAADIVLLKFSLAFQSGKHTSQS